MYISKLTASNDRISAHNLSDPTAHRIDHASADQRHRQGTLHSTMTTILYLILFASACLLSLIVADDASNGRLLDAAMENRIEDVRRELESNGADINIRDKASGQTPLMAAVLRGNTEIVALLLSKGADVEIGEKDGFTPAHGAGFQGRADIMRLLKEHGIDVVGDRHKDGYAPLHRACWGREQRHADTVEYLIAQAGASVNMASGNGRICAEMTRNPATLKLLEKYASGETEL